VQSAATALSGYLPDLVAVRFECASGSVVDMPEECVHHAAAKQRDGRVRPGASRSRRDADLSSRCRLLLLASVSRLPPHASVRRRQHSHGESKTGPACESLRKAGVAEEATGTKGQAPESGPAKHSQHPTRSRGKPTGEEQLLPGGLEAATIADTRGTDRLAAPTAEARLEMADETVIVGGQLTPLEGAHEHDAPSGAVGLISGGEICGTGGKAKPAVDTGVQRLITRRGSHALVSRVTSRSPPGPL